MSRNPCSKTIPDFHPFRTVSPECSGLGDDFGSHLGMRKKKDCNSINSPESHDIREIISGGVWVRIY